MKARSKKLFCSAVVFMLLSVFVMQISAASDSVLLDNDYYYGSGTLYCDKLANYYTTASTSAAWPGDEDYDLIAVFIDFYEYNPAYNATYGDVLEGPQYEYISVPANGINPDSIVGSHFIKRGDYMAEGYTYIYY